MLIKQQHQHDIIYNETSEISIAKEENNDNGWKQQQLSSHDAKDHFPPMTVTIQASQKAPTVDAISVVVGPFEETKEFSNRRKLLDSF